MLFSEIYGSYFNVVAAVLTEAVEETLTAGKLTAIVQEKAFAESVLSIPAALQSDAWPLLDSNFHTVLRSVDSCPPPVFIVLSIFSIYCQLSIDNVFFYN